MNTNNNEANGAKPVVSRRWSIEDTPLLVKFVRKVEIYEAGDVVKLHYKGEADALYKFSGAMFGVSVRRVVDALNTGDAVEYNGRQRLYLRYEQHSIA